MQSDNGEKVVSFPGVNFLQINCGEHLPDIAEILPDHFRVFTQHDHVKTTQRKPYMCQNGQASLIKHFRLVRLPRRTTTMQVFIFPAEFFLQTIPLLSRMEPLVERPREISQHLHLRGLFQQAK